MKYPSSRFGFVHCIARAWGCSRSSASHAWGVQVLGSVSYRQGLPLSCSSCPFLIAFISAPLFFSFLWILKDLAPTRLRWAGAGAGFAAGAIGALVYTLHCPELATPFIATWYLVGMLIPTAIGAWLGPQLLRW
jgi:hypothetical protein